MENDRIYCRHCLAEIKAIKVPYGLRWYHAETTLIACKPTAPASPYQGERVAAPQLKNTRETYQRYW